MKLNYEIGDTILLDGRRYFCRLSDDDDHPYTLVDEITGEKFEWTGVGGKKVNGENMVGSIKDYVKTHREILITLALVALVDHFVFEGQFKKKLQQLVEALLNKAQKQLK